MHWNLKNTSRNSGRQPLHEAFKSRRLRVNGVNSGIKECQTWSFGIWKALVVTHFKALLSNFPGDSKDKEIKRNQGDLVWLGFELDSSLMWSGDTSAMQTCTKQKFILGYCTVWSCRWLPGFQRNLLPPSSGWRTEPAHFFLARCFFFRYFVISVWLLSCFSVLLWLHWFVIF